MTNIRPYSDKELLDKVEEIGGTIPNEGKYLIIGMQSLEDAFNLFDDKFYVFDGPIFKHVSSGTTNCGKTALLMYDDPKIKLTGAAVWKTNQWCPDLYYPGIHRPKRTGGGMRALRQQKPIYFYRDSDKDQLIDETGDLHYDVIYVNMHGIDYNPYSKATKASINGWSWGCQTWNNMLDYRQMIRATWARKKTVDYALLKEF